MARYQDNHPDISRLPGLIAGMKKAQWMEGYREGVCTQEVHSVEKLILWYAEGLVSILPRSFSLDSRDEVRRLARILDKFEYLEKMDSTIPGLEAMHKEVKGIILHGCGKKPSTKSFPIHVNGPSKSCRRLKWPNSDGKM